MAIFGRGFMAGFADGWHKEMDRQHEEKKWNATFEETRRNTLLELAAKRYSSSGGGSSQKELRQYQQDMGYFKDRIATAENAEAASQWLYNLGLSPENASEVRKIVETYELKTGMVMPPDEMVKAIPIIALNADNEEFVSKFESDGDYVQAILTGNLMDNDTYEELYMEGARTDAALGPSSTYRVDPTVFGGDVAGADISDANQYWKLQNDLFQTSILIKAREKRDEYIDAGDVVSAGDLTALINGTKTAQAASFWDSLTNEFGQEVYDDLSSREGQAYRMMDDNPYFERFRTTASTDTPDTSVSDEPTTSTPAVTAEPETVDPQKLAEERQRMTGLANRIDPASKRKLKTLIETGAMDRDQAISAFEAQVAKLLGVKPADLAGVGEYILDVEGL